MSGVAGQTQVELASAVSQNSLVMHLAHNRFLPEPPLELKSCGDGDFRAIGAEFLGYFVHMADLRPDERILEIGCGVGRMAVPLTQYLSDAGEYEGIDVARQGIEWCERPSSRFTQTSVSGTSTSIIRFTTQRNRLRRGRTLPFPDASFDFICLVSVLTHLDSAVLTNYARESSRLLAPGGRCFATAFLVNPPAREALRQGKGRLAFDPDPRGPNSIRTLRYLGCGRLRRGLPARKVPAFRQNPATARDLRFLERAAECRLPRHLHL